MCVFVCVCVCVSVASDSETLEIIQHQTWHGNCLMHHVLIILTLTFIQGHTDLNRENNKCSIISESVQVIPIMLAVKIVRLTV